MALKLFGALLENPWHHHYRHYPVNVIALYGNAHTLHYVLMALMHPKFQTGVKIVSIPSFSVIRAFNHYDMTHVDNICSVCG